MLIPTTPRGFTWASFSSTVVVRQRLATSKWNIKIFAYFLTPLVAVETTAGVKWFKWEHYSVETSAVFLFLEFMLYFLKVVTSVFIYLFSHFWCWCFFLFIYAFIHSTLRQALKWFITKFLSFLQFETYHRIVTVKKDYTNISLPILYWCDGDRTDPNKFPQGFISFRRRAVFSNRKSVLDEVSRSLNKKLLN